MVNSKFRFVIFVLTALHLNALNEIAALYNGKDVRLKTGDACRVLQLIPFRRHKFRKECVKDVAFRKSSPSGFPTKKCENRFIEYKSKIKIDFKVAESESIFASKSKMHNMFEVQGWIFGSWATAVLSIMRAAYPVINAYKSSEEDRAILFFIVSDEANYCKKK